MSAPPEKPKAPKSAPKSSPKKKSGGEGHGSSLPFLHVTEEFAKYLKAKFGVRLNSWVVFIFGIAILFLAFMFMPNIVSYALSMALFLAPVWLSILLITGALSLRMNLKQSEFIA